MSRLTWEQVDLARKVARVHPDGAPVRQLSTKAWYKALERAD